MINNNKSARWDALDVFRGLTIMLMLLNLSPGSWEFNYGWLVHAKWEGWALIDLVAPAADPARRTCGCPRSGCR